MLFFVKNSGTFRSESDDCAWHESIYGSLLFRVAMIKINFFSETLGIFSNG